MIRKIPKHVETNKWRDEETQREKNANVSNVHIIHTLIHSYNVIRRLLWWCNDNDAHLPSIYGNNNNGTYFFSFFFSFQSSTFAFAWNFHMNAGHYFVLRKFKIKKSIKSVRFLCVSTSGNLNHLIDSINCHNSPSRENHSSSSFANKRFSFRCNWFQCSYHGNCIVDRTTVCSNFWLCRENY